MLKGNEVKEQAFPMTRELLSAKDKEKARNFRSDFAVDWGGASGVHLCQGAPPVAIDR